MQSRRTKVCIAITKGTPYGGAQEYVYTLATSLPTDQFEVTALCGEGNTLQDKLREVNIRVIELPHLQRDISILKEIKSFFALINLLRSEKFDVLHTNSSKMGYLGALAGRIARIPKIIFTIHAWAFNESRPWHQKIFFYFLQWKTLFWSHAAIAVSEKTKRDARGMWFVQNKIRVVYNGIAPIEFLDKENAKAFLLEKIGLPIHSDTFIGTIAELHPNKGLDLLIPAFQNLPQNISLFIIGDGQDKARLQMLIQKLGLGDRVFLLGRVEDARHYLKAFNIFTLTSRTEALPYTLLEAGLAECPTLASNVGGIPEIIENNKSGVLVKPETQEIEKALTNLLLHPDIRAQLGQNLKKKIETEFSLEQMIQRTVHIYTQ